MTRPLVPLAEQEIQCIARLRRAARGAPGPSFADILTVLETIDRLTVAPPSPPFVAPRDMLRDVHVANVAIWRGAGGLYAAAEFIAPDFPTGGDALRLALIGVLEQVAKAEREAVTQSTGETE